MNTTTSKILSTRKDQMTGGGIDSYANFIGDDTDYQDWYGFLGQSRDSDALERSNFSCGLKALEEVDPEGNDHRVESYGHWGVGWIEEIYVRPGTECQRIAEEIVSALSNYPVLDEMDFCEREQEEADETWQNCFGVSERLDYIRRNRSQFEWYSFADLRAQIRGEYFGGYASELIS